MAEDELVSDDFFSAFRRCFKRRRRETWWMSPVQGKFKKFNLVGLSRHVKNARRMQHAFWHLDDDIRARIRRRKVKDDIRSHAKRAGARKRPWFDGFPMVALDDDAAPRPSPVRKPPGSARIRGCETVVWDYGTVGLWDYGTMGLWDYLTMGLWDFGALAELGVPALHDAQRQRRDDVASLMDVSETSWPLFIRAHRASTSAI